MRMSPALLGLALLASGSALSSCGSGYQYVKNDDLGVYARVPDGWAVYDDVDLNPDATDRDLERMRQTRWIRTFHGGTGEHDVTLSTTLNGPVPAGSVVALHLSPQERENLDLSALRGGGDPSRDPIAAQQQAPPGESGIQILADDPVEFEGGYTGVHTVFAVAGENGGDPFVIDQTAVRNAESSNIYVFRVGCLEQCYFDTYQDEIADLVDSWTIQEVRS